MATEQGPALGAQMRVICASVSQRRAILKVHNHGGARRPQFWLLGYTLGVRGRRVGPQERGDRFVDVLVEVGAGQRAAGLQ